MRYIGSKRRLAKHYLPIILKGRFKHQYYVEPFVGGCNMIDKVDGLRIGNDINSYIITMWKALQAGWIPPHNITESMYDDIKANPSNYSKEFLCFVGFNSTFGGTWFGTYARDHSTVNAQDFTLQSFADVMRQVPKIQGVEFTNYDYRKLVIPPRSIVYCDPPYKGTVGYGNQFNHHAFWLWVRKMERAGHRVYVSEYEAPADFVCLKEVVKSSAISLEGNHITVERLFRYKG